MFQTLPNAASGYLQAPHSPAVQVFNVSSTFLGNLSTSTATPSCSVQKEDPDAGIYATYCTCDETISLLLLTPTPDNGDIAASCSYTSVPQSAKLDDIPSITAVASTTIGHAFPSYQSSRNFLITAAPVIGEASLPTNQSAKATGCVLTDAYCSLRGPGHALDGLKDTCMLWNPSCSGNKTIALLNMSMVMQTLYENNCFYALSEDCNTRNPPGRIPEFEKVKSWMRSPQCRSSSAEYNMMKGYASAIDRIGADDTLSNFTCCYDCGLGIYNADVYYWPSANLNTSCESIIGDQRLPPDHGATIQEDAWGEFSTTVTYWGCVTRLNNRARSQTWLDTVTLATLATFGSMPVKQYAFNPWSLNASLCPSYSLPLVAPSSTPGDWVAQFQARDVTKSVHTRAHSLIVRSNTTGSDGLPISTMVSDGFTFTSPSVYINLRTISASDKCGTQLISSTMMAFAQEELSTIAGPLASTGTNGTTTKPFNFADFPCPPQSVMEQNWYKPLLGEPYLPLIAIPTRVLSLESYFEYCTTATDFFPALNPPRALHPAMAPVPDATTSGLDVPAPTPMPSPVQDPGPRNTGAVGDSVTVGVFEAGGLLGVGGNEPAPGYHTRVYEIAPNAEEASRALEAPPSSVDPWGASFQSELSQELAGPASSVSAAQVLWSTRHNPEATNAESIDDSPTSVSHPVKNSGLAQAASSDQQGVNTGSGEQPASKPDPVEQPIEPGDTAAVPQSQHSVGSPGIDESYPGVGSSQDSVADNGYEQAVDTNAPPPNYDPSNVSPNEMSQIEGALNTDPPAIQGQGSDGQDATAGDFNSESTTSSSSNKDPGVFSYSGASDLDSSTLSPNLGSQVAKILGPSISNLSPNKISDIAQALASSGYDPSDQLSAVESALAAGGSNLSSDEIIDVENALASSRSKLSLDQLSDIKGALIPDGAVLSPEQVSDVNNALETGGPNLSPSYISNAVNAQLPIGSSLSPNQISNIESILATSGPTLSPEQLSSIDQALQPSRLSLPPDRISELGNALVPSTLGLSPDQISNAEHALATDGSNLSPEQITNVVQSLAGGLRPTASQSATAPTSSVSAPQMIGSDSEDPGLSGSGGSTTTASKSGKHSKTSGGVRTLGKITGQSCISASMVVVAELLMGAFLMGRVQ